MLAKVRVSPNPNHLCLLSNLLKDEQKPKCGGVGDHKNML
jgi:hypothetical protein